MDFEPSTPDPSLVRLVTVLLRYVIAGLSAVGIWHGVVSDAVLLAVASAAVGAGTTIWAIVETIRDKRRDHAGSVQSAKVGLPMQPVKTA